ncbi:hypothetical protein GCM10020219_090670 [Nonomuraea dietziae]
MVFEGTVAGLSRSRTLTGRMLRRITGLKPELREPKGWLPIEGASLHNLKKVSVRVPLGVLTAVTGVAGSGKSTLMTYAEGIAIDQSAIGGSIRSTPATYLGVMDRIRRLFAETNERGREPVQLQRRAARLPRCACGGRGTITMDLAFMDPVNPPSATRARAAATAPRRSRTPLRGCGRSRDVSGHDRRRGARAVGLEGLADALGELGLGT